MKGIDRKEWSIVKRAGSLKHAVRGVLQYVRVTPNAWVHIATFVVLIFLGLFFRITPLNWIILIAINGAVLSAEAFNSAIEIDMDLTNPGQHPMVRDTKDISAGAVLILGVTAWVVDIVIFLPYIRAFF